MPNATLQVHAVIALAVVSRESHLMKTALAANERQFTRIEHSAKGGVRDFVMNSATTNHRGERQAVYMVFRIRVYSCSFAVHVPAISDSIRHWHNTP
jgi:hypothetical protein